MLNVVSFGERAVAVDILAGLEVVELRLLTREGHPARVERAVGGVDLVIAVNVNVEIVPAGHDPQADGRIGRVGIAIERAARSRLTNPHRSRLVGPTLRTHTCSILMGSLPTFPVNHILWIMGIS